MVRTKKHFRPPSSSSSSSSEEEEDDDEINHQVPTGRGKQLGNFGRGKQLNMASQQGRGKQLRAPAPESEESDDDSSESDEDDDEDEEEEDEAQPPPPTSRGKQLRPPVAAVGRGKQLRAPSPPPPPHATTTAENEESDSSTSAAQPSAPAMAVARGGGKQFGRSIGKQLAMQQATPTVDEDDDSDSSSDEEPWAAPVVQRGQGKQLRPPPAPAVEAEEEESDMEESSEEEEEEEEAEVKKTVDDAKPSETKVIVPPKKDDDDDDDEEESDVEPDVAPPPKRGRGRPPTRAAATRAARSTKEAAKKESLPSSEEEEEEDESEEESDEEGSEESSDEEQEWDMETFDTQKLVKGEEDKKYLDSLPELERENILAERFEKLKSEADMKKALRENKRKEREQKKSVGAKNKKRTRSSSTRSSAKKAMPAKKRGGVKKKAESDSENDEAPDTSGDVALAQSLAGKRVSARNLDKKGKQFKKQAALAKIRENRANKHAAVDESDSELDYGRDSDDSDDDYEESNMLKPWQEKGKKKQLSVSSDEELVGDEDDQQTPVGSTKKRTEDPEAELEDYFNVMVPRRKLIHMCNEPYFEKAVKNFYVRLGIGRDKLTQKPCYRLCKITGVTSKSEYSFSPVENQQQVSTDKWLKLSFGKTVKDFKMLTVSDHRPTADEVNQLITQLKIERLTDSILTKKSAIKLCKRQNELVNNYRYSKEDIDMLITEKKKRNKKASNIGYEKTRIAIAVRAAQDEMEEATKNIEDAKVERMEADDSMLVIAEASVKKAEKDLEMATRKLEGRIEEQQRIHKEEQDRINRMKKSSKIQNWVKVNQRAKLANKNADFESYKEQLAKEKIQGSSEPKFDPYARRRVKPKNLWEVGGSKSTEKVTEIANSSGIEEEKKETTERDDTNVGKSGEKDSKREDIPQLQKSVLSGQINQFAYDDEIMIGGDVANLGGIGTKKKIRVRSRKGITLEEYHERKSSGTL